MMRFLISLFLFMLSGCASVEVSKESFNSYYTVTIEHSKSSSTQAILDEASRYCKQYNRIARFNFKINDSNTTFRCDSNY